MHFNILNFSYLFPYFIAPIATVWALVLHLKVQEKNE